MRLSWDGHSLTPAKQGLRTVEDIRVGSGLIEGYIVSLDAFKTCAWLFQSPTTIDKEFQCFSGLYAETITAEPIFAPNDGGLLRS